MYTKTSLQVRIPQSDADEYLSLLRYVIYQKTRIFVFTDIYRLGHEKVARLLVCTSPCYCINFFFVAHPEGGPRKSSPDP